MKLKGISIIEQHVEKVVLLVFALFAIGVFVMQFDLMGPTNAVDIDGKTVRPEQAAAEVRRRAQALKGQMESEGEGVEVPNPPGILAKLEADLRSPVMTATMADINLSTPWSAEAREWGTPSGHDGVIAGGLDNPFMLVAPPAPRDVQALSFAGTIDPLEAASHPGLASYLPAAQPLDKRAVTVQGTFDVAALRAMLEAVPESQSVNPLPRQWWEGRIEILDVELIRQEAYEDGTFGADEVVPILPGRFSMRERLDSETTAPRDLPRLLSDERAQRQEIRRPGFYNMIAGDPWTWPSEASERGRAHPAAEEIDGLVKRYRRVVREHEDTVRRLEAAKKRPTNDGPRRQPKPTRGDASGSMGGGEGRWPSIPPAWFAQGDRNPGDEGRDRRRRQRENLIKGLEEDIEGLSQEMDEIERRFKDLGVDTDGNLLGGKRSTGFDEALTSLTGTDSPETVTLWGHDITVQAGRTYRYKMRVRVTNPLFGNGAQVPESQQALAMEPAVVSADSAWSSPVETYPERVYFVSSALDASGSGFGVGLRQEAQASVSVYEFFYGYWRGDSVSLRRGDQVRVTVELPELPVWAIDVDGGPRPVIADEPTMLATERVISEGAVLIEVGIGLAAGDLGQVHEVIFGQLSDGGLEVRVAELDSENELAWAVRGSSERGAQATVRKPGATGGKNEGARRRPRGRDDGEDRGPERERR